MLFQIQSLLPFLLFFLNFTTFVFSTQHQHHRSNTSSSSSNGNARITCETTNDCPTHSVCYQNTCICNFGFVFTDRTRCIPTRCSTDLDCLQTFLHSVCTGNGSCACATDAYLDPFNQECYSHLNRVALWFGFIGILSIIIFLPAGKLFCEHRRLKRLNDLLEAQMLQTAGGVEFQLDNGQLCFGNVNYEAKPLKPTLSNREISFIACSPSGAQPPKATTTGETNGSITLILERKTHPQFLYRSMSSQ